MTFVLMIPSFEDIFHAYYAGEIIKGASLAASRLKVDLLVRIPARQNHREWLDDNLLNRDFISGIIFGDIDDDVDIVKKSISAGMPTLVLNNYFQEPINCITVDNYEASLNVVRHLIKLGHTRIATIAGDIATQAAQLRLKGFCDGLREAGIKIPKYYFAEGDFLRTVARTSAQRLIKMKVRPTAIFAASDVMALEVIDVARAHGIRVPDDLSVVGFDDNPLNIHSPVRLTTVYQPLGEMGRLGVEHLRQIAQGKAKLPVKVQLSTKLVSRDSTARCTVI